MLQTKRGKFFKLYSKVKPSYHSIYIYKWHKSLGFAIELLHCELLSIYLPYLRSAIVTSKSTTIDWEIFMLT